jgi:imidazolonepropionase
MNVFIKNIRQLVTVRADGQATKTGPQMRDLGIVEDGAVLCREGRIAWVGTTGEFPGPLGDDIEIMDGSGLTALPGFVDAHTHTVFAGSRVDEFALRSAGATYQQIAEQGGGILSTIRAVRGSTKKELKKTARRYLTDMLRHGTTTVEIKSGYGLSMDAEVTLLEAIRELAEEELAEVVPTFLGAHAVPPEYAGDPEGYVRLVVEKMIPYVGTRRLAEFCDVFCERGYFTPAQTELILAAAATAGLKLKIHAEELTSTGGAELAARLGACSADHLEHISDTDIAALGAAGVVAVLLPGVSFFLHHRYAPARRLIDSGVPVALATDFNPGSCMSYSIPLMMTIACTQMQMSPEECITACTLNAAAAVDRSRTHGSIEVGKSADILLADVPDVRFLAYHFGTNHIRTVIKHGTILEL